MVERWRRKEEGEEGSPFVPKVTSQRREGKSH